MLRLPIAASPIIRGTTSSLRMTGSVTREGLYTRRRSSGIRASSGMLIGSRRSMLNPLMQSSAGKTTPTSAVGLIGGADAHVVSLAQQEPADVERHQLLGLKQNSCQKGIQIDVGPQRAPDQILGGPDDGVRFLVDDVVHDVLSRRDRLPAEAMPSIARRTIPDNTKDKPLIPVHGSL